MTIVLSVNRTDSKTAALRKGLSIACVSRNRQGMGSEFPLGIFTKPLSAKSFNNKESLVCYTPISMFCIIQFGLYPPRRSYL